MSWRRSYAYEQLMVRMVYMMGLTLTGSLGFVIYARYVGDFKPATLDRMMGNNDQQPPADDVEPRASGS